MPDEKKEATELSRRLTIALVTPIALLIVAGTILGLQVFRMASDAAWVDHTDSVIASREMLSIE